MVHFRDAKHEDYEVIATFPQNEMELFHVFPSGEFPLLPSQLEKAASVRLHPTVILSKDEIIGYSNLYDLVDGLHCWLGNVIISPHYRGKGIGKYLIDQMKVRAKEELRVEELRLVCHNTNTAALLFYKKQGFKPYDIKQIEHKQGYHVAGILMEIEL
jgi:ribosomal protein S18 acetylase RimI-like enzyme